jgi:rubrerythrin
MSYTTILQCQNNNDITFLIEGMISEITAVNDYSYSLTLTENKEIKDILYRIMKENKKHYGAFLKALQSTDKEFSSTSQDIDNQTKNNSKISYNEYLGSKESKLLLTSIRNAIKDELEAIILYTNFLDNVKSNELFKIIKVISLNKKEHIEKLTKLLNLIDSDSYIAEVLPSSRIDKFTN